MAFSIARTLCPAFMKPMTSPPAPESAKLTQLLGWR
jgi:hypothetical protein